MKPLAAAPSAMRRSGIRELMALAEGLDDVIHLEIGEPDADTPEPIVAGAFAGARAGFTRYTPTAGFASLREAVAARLSRDHGLTLNPAQVVVTPGAVGALVAACFALLDPGDEILVPDPGWPNYATVPRLVGAVPVPYRLRREDGFLPDIGAVERLVSPRTKALLMTSPANPTGAVFPESTVRALVEIAARHDLYLVSDEVYEVFVFEGEHVPAARFDHAGRVVTISGWSKTYAMTGWRLGYAVASPPVADVMSRVQEKLASCPSSVSQKAAEAALAMDQGPVAAMRDAYRARRDLAVAVLGPRLAAVPHGAFYALVDVSAAGLDTYAIARELLTEARVVTAPGEAFGASAAGLVRISLAAADDQLREGSRRIARYLEGRGG